MLQRTLFLIVVLTCCRDLHAQSVNLSQKVVAPPDNIITADWLKSRPHNSKVMAIVPADFSSPPRLLLTDSVYLNEYCQHGSPSWSRDGSVIVLEVAKDLPFREKMQTANVVIVRPDGSHAKDLGRGVVPDVSPDGDQIAYMKMDAPPRTVQLMTTEGQDRRPLPHEAHTQGCQWSPDGKSIVALGEFGSLRRYDIGNQASSMLVPEGRFGHLWEFAWTPDGTKLVFLQNRSVPTVVGEFDLTLSIVDLSTSPHRTIDFPETYLSEPFMTVPPDGKRIVYAQDGVLMEVEISKPNSTPRPVKGQYTDFSYGNAAYSHDGKWLAVAIN